MCCDFILRKFVWDYWWVIKRKLSRLPEILWDCWKLFWDTCKVFQDCCQVVNCFRKMRILSLFFCFLLGWKFVWDYWWAVKRFRKDVYVISTMLFSVRRKFFWDCQKLFWDTVKFFGIVNYFRKLLYYFYYVIFYSNETFGLLEVFRDYWKLFWDTFVRRKFYLCFKQS